MFYRFKSVSPPPPRPLSIYQPLAIVFLFPICTSVTYRHLLLLGQYLFYICRNSTNIVTQSYICRNSTKLLLSLTSAESVQISYLVLHLQKQYKYCYLVLYLQRQYKYCYFLNRLTLFAHTVCAGKNLFVHTLPNRSSDWWKH